jgi:phage shock protein E
MNMQNTLIYLIAAAFVGSFIWKQIKYKQIKAKLPELLQQGAILIDVRTANEYSMSNNPRCKNIPLDEISAKINTFDKNITIILCCRSGNRSGMAAAIFKRNGFTQILNAGPWTNTLV